MTTEFSRVENTVACILARKIAYHFGKHFLAALILLASLAGVASSEINLPEITKAYVEAAFPPGIDRLRKIENSDHVSYRLDCADGNMQRCNDALKYFRATIFENPNMKLEQNEFGRILFSFANQDKLLDRKKQLSNEPSFQMIDADDLECQLYLKLKQDNIVAAAIIVSLDSSPQKITSCLLLNFYRAIGLSQENSFSFKETWSKNPSSDSNLPLEELQKLPWFQELRNAIISLEYIHSCPALTPGMLKSDVVTELSSSSVCLRDIRGAKDGG